MKYIILFLSLFLFSGCFNRDGVSLTYYSDCDEYYDASGFYHRDCTKNNLFTYDQLKNKLK